MIVKKAVCTLVLCALLSLSGCVHIDNMEPTKAPTSEIATVERVASAAEAVGNQSDIVALAAQTRRVLDLLSNAYSLQRATYNDRVGGIDYNEAIRDRLEKAIPSNWELGEEAGKLYAIAKRSRPELATEGIELAKAVLDLADVSDESDQFDLGYTIAGIETNSDYLGSENEDIFNALAKNRADASKKANAMMKEFVAHLSAVQAGGAPAQFSMSDVGTNASNPVEVLITGSKLGKAHLKINASKKTLLQMKVEQVVAKTSLAMRPKKASISMEVGRMGSGTAARYIKNVVTFAMVGYLDFGGGKTMFAAFAQEAGGEKIQLAISSFPISAKDIDTLAQLMAYRVVGRTEMLFLREDMK